MMIMQIINGEKYIYKIDDVQLGEQYLFILKAIDQINRRASIINTVNPLLSELEINSNNNRFWEPEWIVTKDEVRAFSEKIKNMLTDKKYLEYFEDFLDQDRIESEWENIEEQS